MRKKRKMDDCAGWDVECSMILRLRRPFQPQRRQRCSSTSVARPARCHRCTKTLAPTTTCPPTFSRLIQLQQLELDDYCPLKLKCNKKERKRGCALNLPFSIFLPGGYRWLLYLSILVLSVQIGLPQWSSANLAASSSVNSNAISGNLIKQQVQTPSSASLLAAVGAPRQLQFPATTIGAGSNSAQQTSSREIEKQIVDKILGEGYDKRIRPAGSGPYNASQPGNDGPTIVKVNTLIRSISKIDDVTMEYSVQLSLRQEWTDDRLAFGKMPQYKHYGLNSITLTEQERLWKPDLFFRNEKEGHFHKIIMPNVLLRIKGEGQVLYSIRISLVLACPMDLKYYPLDKQNCTIEMASYGYIEEDLKFMWKEDSPVQISKPLNLPRFALETHNTSYCTSLTTTGAYSCLRIDLIFKREFSYYLIQIYIPCCMLVIVSWVSFWLDPNAIPARVSLGVTTLLTMATQISGINASLPPVSYTKAIDVWTGVCLTFVFGALLEFALVNYASRSDQHKREMLNSALTHTQQMRWREATAAAAAAGVAPPTSPPTDENSPSALAGKQPAFFGPSYLHSPLPYSLGLEQPTQARGFHCSHHYPSHFARTHHEGIAEGGVPASMLIAASKSSSHLVGQSKRGPSSRCLLPGGCSVCGIPTVDGSSTAYVAIGGGQSGLARNEQQYDNSGTSSRLEVVPNELLAAAANGNDSSHIKNTPQINYALQCQIDLTNRSHTS